MLEIATCSLPLNEHGSVPHEGNGTAAKIDGATVGGKYNLDRIGIVELFICRNNSKQKPDRQEGLISRLRALPYGRASA